MLESRFEPALQPKSECSLDNVPPSKKIHTKTFITFWAVFFQHISFPQQR